MKFLFFPLFLLPIFMWAQPPVADFTIAATACKEQKLEIENSSLNGSRYEWDFCLEDFRAIKTQTNAAVLSGLSNGFGVKLIEDDGNWFGFVVSQTGPKIFRLDFGNSPLNSPVVTDLGNPGNLLVFPQDMEVYKNGNQWIGIVGYNDNGYGLVRLNFGAAITNTPSAEHIGDFGIFGRFWDLEIVEQGADIILVILERNTGSFIRVNYGNSLLNAVNPATQVFTSAPLPLVSLTPGFSLIKKGNEWKALVTSYVTNSLHQVSFGTDILGAPVSEAVYNFAGVNRPYRVRLLQEGNGFYAAISNETEPITLIDFKGLDISQTPEPISHAGLPAFIGLETLRYKGQDIVFGVGTANNILKQIVFESACGSNVLYSEAENPGIVTYAEEGTKSIELIAFNSLGDRSIKSSSVNVVGQSSPDIDFTTNGFVCAQSDVSFSTLSQVGDIVVANWDFGNGQVGAGSTITHAFQPGDYTVRVDVQSANMCPNFAERAISIYPEPVPDFLLPSGLICANNEFLFENTTADNYNGLLTFQWRVDGGVVSNERHLLHTFTEGGNKTISLEANLPGCVLEETKNLDNVGEGPVVGFTTSGVCVEAVVDFSNNSTGSISGYLWNFGNGEQSTEEDPSTTFAVMGTYLISLQTFGTNGCVSTTSKPITIFSKPQPDFTLDLPPFSCTGTPSQFHDSTPVPDDSNLESWVWTFSANGTGMGKNPTYTYSQAGEQNVGLLVTTDRGCSASISKTVTIAPSPQPDFSYDAACINKLVRFETTTADVKAWQWKINQSNYPVQNPSHVFLFPDTYNAQLTVTASNDCVASTTKSIIVPEVPTLDFTIEGVCIDAPSKFTSLSNSPTDPTVFTTWNFGSGQTASGTSVDRTFDEAGNFAVTMRVENESGCAYELVKNVTIYSPPMAAFTLSADTGPPPLEVEFTNQSVGAASYRWFNNNEEQSNTTHFSTTLTEVGSYVIDLFATSPQGCVASATGSVNVIIPRTDLLLEEFNLIEDVSSGSTFNQLRITNKGNYTVRSFDVVLDLGNGTSVRERVTTSISPNATSTVVLANALLGVSSGFVCVKLLIDGDESTQDNERCVPLRNQPVLFSPSPNPAKDVVHLQVISSTVAVGRARFVNQLGLEVASFELRLVRGLNEVTVDVRGLQPGIYFITVEVDEQRLMQRLFVQ